MEEKPIFDQIADEFQKALQESGLFTAKQLEDIQKLLGSETAEKDAIVKVFEEEQENEDPRD